MKKEKKDLVVRTYRIRKDQDKEIKKNKKVGESEQVRQALDLYLTKEK